MLDETPAETPELGGYSLGLIDESNPAPRGAVEFDSQDELDKAVAAAEDNILSQIDGRVKPAVVEEKEEVVARPRSINRRSARNAR
jgi:hypothetical protein